MKKYLILIFLVSFIPLLGFSNTQALPQNESEWVLSNYSQLLGVWEISEGPEKGFRITFKKDGRFQFVGFARGQTVTVPGSYDWDSKRKVIILSFDIKEIKPQKLTKVEINGDILTAYDPLGDTPIIMKRL